MYFLSLAGMGGWGMLLHVLQASSPPWSRVSVVQADLRAWGSLGSRVS